MLIPRRRARQITFSLVLLGSSWLTLAGIVSTSMAASDPQPEAAFIPGRYIVVFNDSVDHPGNVAEAQTEQHGGGLTSVYRYALKGYAAKLSKGAVTALRSDPRVAYVEPDVRGSLMSQTTPTGISRIAAPSSSGIFDDNIADADVAVIDSGIAPFHPDLTVVSLIDCTTGECAEETEGDRIGHGTHVGGIVGAHDNDFGVVGVAPGARLWSMKVADDEGGVTLSAYIAAVDWVTAHADQIEVANASLGIGASQAATEAVQASVDAGVVHVASAGNAASELKSAVPASIPDVIAVSALADYDGGPGGKGSPTCADRGPDDTLATFSNWGSAIDIIAPGVCIYSTVPESAGGYAFASGTSMASPYVAGAAALLASDSGPSSFSQPESRKDVEAIRSALISEGSFNWTDTSGDGIQEPLLQLSDKEMFNFLGRPMAYTEAPSGVSGSKATLRGRVYRRGFSTTYQFEYGLTTAYGSKAPASPKGIESGSEAVAAPLEGLPPSTTYHYRVVATNSQGTSYGNDETFTTWGSWSLQSTPNPAQPLTEARFENVSCPSSTSCLAVGENKQKGNGYFAAWNGSNWESLVGFSPADVNRGVSCVATTCRTVSQQGSTLFSEAWSESAGKWSFASYKSLPQPAEATAAKLRDISCTSASACTAVGSYVKEGKTKTLAERWNGSSWSIQTTPNPEAGNAELIGVSCESATSCTAVGKQGLASYAMRWNGSSWTATSTPSPAGAIETDLQKVSCTSAGFCMAAGAFKESEKNKKTLALKWNGSAWSIATTPNPATNYGAILSGVSCASSTSCTAVGRYVSAATAPYEAWATEEKTLTLSWGGSEWAIQSSPNPEGKKFSMLNGVSCSAAAACTAVGSAGLSKSGEMVTLGERWNGSSWSLQSTPNPAQPLTEARFENVSCPSSTSCLAVGENKQKGNGYFAAWNGSNWESLVGFSPADVNRGVSCVATTCRTVSQQGSTLFSEAWSESAGKWSFASYKSLPQPAEATAAKLRDISCTSASACTAVGSYVKEGKTKTLAERWNGSSWSIQTTPNPEAGNAELIGVSCESATSCTAVGKQGLASYAMRWNGSSWTATSTPSPAGAIETDLQKVSCTSAGFCMAAGAFKESEKNKKTLALKWNGSAWSIATTPNPATNYGAILSGVSCASSTSCTAVGRYVSAATAPYEAWATEEKTLTLSWGGSEWAIQSSPNPEGKKFSMLNGVSCSAAAACTAVGSAGLSKSGEMVTLGERYQ